jgi:hypothetical protein
MLMAKLERLNERYVIGTPGGTRSNIWRVFSRKSDVYVTASSPGGVEKFSFHESGICRKAFTQEYGTPDGLPDRATIKWRRAVTPPTGKNEASFVFEVGVPTNCLSVAVEPPKKEVTWIAPASPGMITVLRLYYTREPVQTARVGTEPYGQLLSYTALPNGEAFVAVSFHTTWEGKPLRVPASHHQAQDYLFADSDPCGTGRPARIVVFSHPRDGDRMLAWEYGGYKVPPSAVIDTSGYDTRRKSSVPRSSHFSCIDSSLAAEVSGVLRLRAKGLRGGGGRGALQGLEFARIADDLRRSVCYVFANQIFG